MKDIEIEINDARCVGDFDKVSSYPNAILLLNASLSNHVEDVSSVGGNDYGQAL